MDKQLKDFLHYYLGCQIDTGTGYVTLIAVQKEVIPCADFRVIVLNGNVIHELAWDDKCRLALRRLEDMTDAELKERCFSRNQYTDWLHYNDQKWPINDLLWFLENKFDVFDLIREGYAVDKATIKS